MTKLYITANRESTVVIETFKRSHKKRVAWKNPLYQTLHPSRESSC